MSISGTGKFTNHLSGYHPVNSKKIKEKVDAATDIDDSTTYVDMLYWNDVATGTISSQYTRVIVFRPNNVSFMYSIDVGTYSGAADVGLYEITEQNIIGQQILIHSFSSGGWNSFNFPDPVRLDTDQLYGIIVGGGANIYVSPNDDSDNIDTFIEKRNLAEFRPSGHTNFQMSGVDPLNATGTSLTGPMVLYTPAIRAFYYYIDGNKTFSSSKINSDYANKFLNYGKVSMNETTSGMLVSSADLMYHSIEATGSGRSTALYFKNPNGTGTGIGNSGTDGRFRFDSGNDSFCQYMTSTGYTHYNNQLMIMGYIKWSHSFGTEASYGITATTDATDVHLDFNFTLNSFPHFDIMKMPNAYNIVDFNYTSNGCDLRFYDETYTRLDARIDKCGFVMVVMLK